MATEDWALPDEDWFLDDELEPYTIEREGVRCDVPAGWDCRIGKQWEKVEGERAFLFLHATTRPLTGFRADYGGGIVEKLSSRDVFIALIEFGPSEAGSALFKEVTELPALEVSSFHRNQLQRRIRGQAGKQHFFTINGRPFCLYVVLGSIANAVELVEEANGLLQGITIGLE
jgi:hypothetical protein